MKTWYKIGLFFICIIIVCLMIVILWERHSYPDDSMEQSQEQQDFVLQNNLQHKEEISQANQADVTTTCDTICLYEEINQKDHSIHIEEVQLPVKYIGMTRQQLEEALKNDNSISSEDKQKGLVSQHLESFSKDKVKIIRIFDAPEDEIGYYIMVQYEHVCVFKADKQTLYFQSGILLEDLPLTVQEEVKKGKYMSSEMEVFHFLESYSS